MLQLTSLCVVGRQAICLYGLDKDGQVWEKIGDKTWYRVSMQTTSCPSCKRSKDNPELIVKANGYGTLNKYCSHEFHRDEK